MVTVNDILSCLDQFAPVSTAMDFDNVGLLAGFPEREVTRVLCALDVTDGVIAEAEAMGAELIIAHHPLIFRPLRSVRSDDPVGRKVIRLVRGGISAICMHTNLDAAAGGVNDALMDVLEIPVTGLLSVYGTLPDGTPYGIERIGELPEAMPLEDFLARTKAALNCRALRYVPGGRPVKKIAVCGGSGGSELEAVIAAGCDTYVTADLKYDRLLLAREAGINLIDADHFCTENVVVPRLRDRIASRFPSLDVYIAEKLEQTAHFY